MKYEINSPQDMMDLWEKIWEKYDKILLVWELWSWKTHFAKWFVKKFSNKNVTSPTYTYMNIYDDILHIDMRRIENEADFKKLGILDQMNNFDKILIEWPKFENYYSDEDFIKVEIKKVDLEKRLVMITKC